MYNRRVRRPQDIYYPTTTTTAKTKYNVKVCGFSGFLQLDKNQRRERENVRMKETFCYCLFVVSLVGWLVG